MRSVLLALVLTSFGTCLALGSSTKNTNSHWLRVFVDDLVFPDDPDVTITEESPQEQMSRAASLEPPPHDQVARMARYILHQSDWTSMATLSSRANFSGYPTANVFSVSDGPTNNSSGTPYFYLSAWELSVHDLAKNNRASITMSLAQGQYCKVNAIDPEDPTCAHVIFTGRIIFLKDGQQEADFARKALFTRHPAMEGWPKGHEWSFAKLEIEDIMLLDYYGGVKHLNIEEYYNATPY